MIKHAAFGLVALSFLGAVAACTTTRVVEVVDPALADAGTKTETTDAAVPPEDTTGKEEELTTVAGKSGKLFDWTAKSFAKVKADGTVASVGVVFPLVSFTSGPANHSFQDDLVLDMPDVAKEQTMLHHLRANWLVQGHGPNPYGEPHFDFHFLRGTRAEIDAIDCRANKTLPGPDKIPAGYGPPELCVSAMGFHSWPKADTGGGKFAASLIMGFWKDAVVFVEPMIPVATFKKKQTFEIAISKPASLGGATTLYPTRMLATWAAETEEYTFEFDHLETID